MLKFIAKLEAWIAVSSIVIMFSCIILQVFCRYVLHHALEWPEEVARYAFISSVFFGAAVAAGEGRHLEISFCKYAFGRRVQSALTIISAICAMLFCALMVWWGSMMVRFVYESGQMAESMHFPMWPLYVIVPLGMLCMFFKIPFHARCSLRDAKNRSEEEAGAKAISDQASSW